MDSEKDEIKGIDHKPDHKHWFRKRTGGGESRSFREGGLESGTKTAEAFTQWWGKPKL